MTPPRAPSYRARIMKYKTTILALAAAAAFLPGTATAALIVNIEEVGSNVVASYSGSIDTTGMGFNLLATSTTRRITASGGNMYFAGPDGMRGGVLTDFGQTPWTVAPTPFGSGGLFNADSFSIADGDSFGFQTTGFFVRFGYTSGTPISGSMTFENETLASMGINVGDGIMNATFSSGDTLTVNATGGDPAPVPEPGTWAAAALLASGAAFARWRRRQRTAG
jgi:hypothetical protein